MCGIFALLNGRVDEIALYLPYFYQTKHRGPDNTKVRSIDNGKLYYGFHRLCINGLDRKSDQPFENIEGCTLVCNGEIYNYKQLVEKYDLPYETHSDCEVIIHLYRRFGIEKTCQLLDGVFAFSLYDHENDQMYVARDPIGIRSLFWSHDSRTNTYGFCSEMKGLLPATTVQQFPPGTWCSMEYPNIFNKYYYYNWTPVPHSPSKLPTIYATIRTLLVKGVDKRRMSDRPICALLSGGLDSTLITYILSCVLGEKHLNTYSTGFEHSVDLKYAQLAADTFGTNHHNCVVTEKQFLDMIEPTIKQIGSYCVTSVRASVGNFWVCKEIEKCPDGDTVVFCGDLSDELFGSYRGFAKAPNSEQFFEENVDMLKKVYFFDVLRSDASISGAGLEARVPFADKEFIDYVMKLDPKLKMFDKDRMEKYVLRKAFEGELPDELLWRRKEAFSDGVSGHERSWFEIIREHVDTIYTDEECKSKCAKYKYNPPTDKESLWYREIFEKHYPGRATVIPHMWKHPFYDKGADPSARLLDCY